MAGPIRAPVGSRLIERVLQISQRQEALVAAVGRLKKLVKLLAGYFAATVTIEPQEHERAGGWGKCACGEVKVGAFERFVAVMVEPREVAVAARKLSAFNLAVTVAVVALLSTTPSRSASAPRPYETSRSSSSWFRPGEST